MIWGKNKIQIYFFSEIWIFDFDIFGDTEKENGVNYFKYFIFIFKEKLHWKLKNQTQMDSCVDKVTNLTDF